MTEDTSPLTAQDEADLKLLGDSDTGITHTLLEIWLDVLGNIEADAKEKVTPAAANRIVNVWTKLTFADVSVYQRHYYALLIELREILSDMIHKHPDCLKNTSQEKDAFGLPAKDSDVVGNRELYIDLLFDWQARIIEWEHEWDSDDPEAAARLAAIADATAFFVGPQGLVEHLSQIGFQYSDEDRDALAARLQSHREGL